MFFIDANIYQTQPARANCYYWSLPAPKNIVPYAICFVSIMKTKDLHQFKSFLITCIRLLWIPRQILSKIFKGLLDSATGRRRNNYRKTLRHSLLSEAMQIKAFERLWNLKKIHAIFKQIEYLAFLTEVCVVMLWVTPATRVVVVRFFF